MLGSREPSAERRGLSRKPRSEGPVIMVAVDLPKPVTVRATLVNTTVRGLGVLLRHPVPRGARFCLAIPVPGTKDVRLGLAEVRWCRPTDSEPPEYRVGLELLACPER
jgi:hypothetical protein